MKNKIINFIIYIMVFIIIFASFLIPNKLFEIQDQNLEMAIYSENNSKSNNISMEVEDIYLVKALHDIESENTVVVIVSKSDEKISSINTVADSTKVAEIKSKVEELKQHNIIKNNEILDDSKMLVTTVNKTYMKNETNYEIYNVSLSVNNHNYQMDIDEKTGKIIKIITNKQNLNDTIEKKQILENYIKYLDLYFIDDWVYDNNMMKSKKADVSVSLLENVKNSENILAIHSNGTISENLIEYFDVEN